MAGTIQVTGTIISPTGDSKTINLAIQASPAVDERLDVNLVAGDNPINIPPGSAGCYVIPPASNVGATAVALKSKNVAGDSGQPKSGSIPWQESFPVATPASFIINASAALAGVVIDFF